MEPEIENLDKAVGIVKQADSTTLDNLNRDLELFYRHTFDPDKDAERRKGSLKRIDNTQTDIANLLDAEFGDMAEKMAREVVDSFAKKSIDGIIDGKIKEDLENTEHRNYVREYLTEDGKEELREQGAAGKIKALTFKPIEEDIEKEIAEETKKRYRIEKIREDTHDEKNLTGKPGIYHPNDSLKDYSLKDRLLSKLPQKEEVKSQGAKKEEKLSIKDVFKKAEHSFVSTLDRFKNELTHLGDKNRSK